MLVDFSLILADFVIDSLYSFIHAVVLLFLIEGIDDVVIGPLLEKRVKFV